MLGLEPGASQEEVRRAWRTVPARCHPDRGGNTEDFRVAKVAGEILFGLSMSGHLVGLDELEGRFYT